MTSPIFSPLDLPHQPRHNPRDDVVQEMRQSFRVEKMPRFLFDALVQAHDELESSPDHAPEPNQVSVTGPCSPAIDGSATP